MKTFPLIVCYYTQDTFYQLEVQNLIASCEKWGLAYHAEPIPSFGSWEMNCAYKPLFLYQKLEELQCPLFWVDADAVFLKKPSWLEVFSSDMAVRITQEFGQDHPSFVISGSVYVNNTEKARRVLKAWARKCIDHLSDPQRTVELWDQVALRDVLYQTDHQASIEPLPPGYMMILGNEYDEKSIEDRVIGHYQASRRFKKIINGIS